MKDYIQIDINHLSNLEEVVRLLEVYNEIGAIVYCDFNGHILYSDKTTMDSAYIEVCGKTKSEYDKESLEYIERFHKLLEESQKQMKKRK